MTIHDNMFDKQQETPAEPAIKDNPQRKMWEDCGVFATYAEAKSKSDSLESESKVKRCGAGGTKFKVKRVIKYLEGKK
jgi:hypothetical protein